MVHQDRIETNLLLLFAQQENSEWLSIISAIIFEVNIVAEQKQKHWERFACFLEVFFSLNFILLLLSYCCFGVPEKKHEWKRSIAANKAQILKPIFPLSYKNAHYHQNRSQKKIFNKRSLRLCRVVFNNSNWGTWILFGEILTHRSIPPWRRDWVPPDHLGSEISFLHTCTIPKHCENLKTKRTYLYYVCTLFLFW